METTPVSIRVARWTAVAAGITALGSLFQTVWTEKPWWIAEKESVHVSPAPAPVTKNAERFRSAQMERSEPANVMSVSPSMTVTPAKTTVSTWSWIGMAAIGITLVAGIAEWFLRKKHSGNTVPPFPVR